MLDRVGQEIAPTRSLNHKLFDQCRATLLHLLAQALDGSLFLALAVELQRQPLQHLVELLDGYRFSRYSVTPSLMACCA